MRAIKLMPIVFLAACVNTTERSDKIIIDSGSFVQQKLQQDSVALSDSVLSFVLRIIPFKKNDTARYQFMIGYINNGVYSIQQTTNSKDGMFSPTVNWWNFDIATKRLWRGLTGGDRIYINYDTLKYRF